MMPWIAISREIPNDPKVHALADATGLDVDACIGKLVRVFAAMAEHRPDGELSDVSARTLEAWANWRGRREVFATHFLALFAPDGKVTAWEKYNGAKLRKAERDRKRLRDQYSQDSREILARENGENSASVNGAFSGAATESLDWSVEKSPAGSGSRQSRKSRNANETPEILARESRGSRDLLAGDIDIDKESSSTSNPPLTTQATNTHGPDARAPRAKGEPVGFAAAWAALPRRDGSNPRNRAAHAYAARLRDGVGADVLYAGAVRYAAYCDAKGVTGSAFVMQGARFFGPGCEFLEPWRVDEPPPVDLTPDPALNPVGGWFSPELEAATRP